MRSLSAEEKSIAVKLLKAPRPLYIGNFLDPLLPGLLIIQSTTSSTGLDVIYDNLNNLQPPDCVAIIDEAKSKIITVVNLLNMFEKDGYITLVDMAANTSPISLGQGTGDFTSVLMAYPDMASAELIKKYTYKEAILNQEFNRFIANDCVSQDEIRFQLQRKVALRALCVSTIALVVSATTLFIKIGDHVINSDSSSTECHTNSTSDEKIYATAISQILTENRKTKIRDSIQQADSVLFAGAYRSRSDFFASKNRIIKDALNNTWYICNSIDTIQAVICAPRPPQKKKTNSHEIVTIYKNEKCTIK